MNSKHLIAATALAVASLAAQAQAPQYAVTSLGISPASAGGSSTASTALAISSSGNYVVGRSLWQGGSTIYGPNFTWSASTGSVDWTMPAGRYGASLIETSAINNNGVAVGSLGTNIGNASLVPYMWNGTTATALAMPTGQITARVADINDSGLAVGQAGSGTTGQALIYNTNAPSAAPTVITAQTSTLTLSNSNGTTFTGTATMTAALQINNAGYIVGTGYLGGNTAAPVSLAYDSLTGSMSFMDLTSLAGGNIGAVTIYGMSENGWVVGTLGSVGFRWKDGVGAQAITAPTGVTGSVVPYAINSAGDVVGKTGTGPTTSLFYSDGSTSYSLDSMIAGSANGWSLSNSNATAFGIADNGNIIVTGVNAGVTGTRALLLTPVPEPTSWALMLAGLAGVGAVVRRRTVKA